MIHVCSFGYEFLHLTILTSDVAKGSLPHKIRKEFKRFGISNVEKADRLTYHFRNRLHPYSSKSACLNSTYNVFCHDLSF